MTGLGNYSRLVIEKLAQEYPEERLAVYAPTLSQNPRLETIHGLSNVEWHTPKRMRNLPGAVWRSLGMAKDACADGAVIFHGLSNELPLNIRSAGVTGVVTMHDVIYRRLPYCYRKADRWLYDMKYGHSCRAAHRIIAISEATKHDVMEFYGVGEDKIDVIYQGCDDIFRRQSTDEERIAALKAHSIHNPYLIQVGSIERRKNLELSIRALAALESRYDNIILVAVGRGGKYAGEMKQLAAELGVAHRLICLDNVTFRELPHLYQSAEIILYPSHYEGFGIPILEGLESRRPVIAANTSSLPEAGGDAALYIEPHDVQGMKESIAAILSGATDTGTMIERGLRHARRFDTSTMASNIMATYHRALSSASGSE